MTARRRVSAPPLRAQVEIARSRIAPLNHQARQSAVEPLTIVETVLREVDDMADGFWRIREVGLDHERALRRFDDEERRAPRVLHRRSAEERANDGRSETEPTDHWRRRR